MKKNPSKTVLIFFGPPGSGKGTQAEMLEKEIKLPIVSPGSLLRHEIDLKSKLGKSAQKYVHLGEFVPEEIIEKILHQRLEKNDLKKGFILDGYPRNKTQLMLLKEKLDRLDKKGGRFEAVYIDVGDKEILNRLSGRRVCDCGDTYHLKFNPPKKKNTCDSCGKKLYVRDDDRLPVIRKRLKSFYQETNPIIDYFKEQKKLIIINGEQKIIKVYEELLKKLKKHLQYDHN